jgi:hypothetical protein
VRVGVSTSRRLIATSRQAGAAGHHHRCQATAEYTVNLTQFIRDVRQDFRAPTLPFFVGQMGVEGMNLDGSWPFSVLASFLL